MDIPGGTQTHLSTPGAYMGHTWGCLGISEGVWGHTWAHLGTPGTHLGHTWGTPGIKKDTPGTDMGTPGHTWALAGRRLPAIRGSVLCVHDVYAMYLCHLQRAQVKGHSPGGAGAFLCHERLMVLHHGAMVLVCFPVATVWRQGKGDFFLGCLLMAELSTPLVCLGKVLILLHLQHTALHKLNAVALLLTFLLCWVLLFPYLYWAYGRHRGLALLRVPSALPAAYNMTAIAMATPQLYWFSLICRGAWRLFRPAQSDGGGDGAA
uniref:TLC domain-containing protein n=1 Tax=Catharus ustulatus TaxID=91951 RepID=A0A8C3UAC2_CATUS